MTPRWRDGNFVELLENGEEFYPRVFQAIEAARHEVFLETFILREDRVGNELARVLVAAAERGVRVEVTVDAWGSMDLGVAFIDSLVRAGVCFHLFEAKRPRWLLRVSWFRRLHRKLVVVDAAVGFVGGINFSEDHLLDSGPQAKRDFAVRVEGPVVCDIHALARQAVAGAHGDDRAAGDAGPWEDSRAMSRGDMRALFIVRDNRRGYRTAIETHYRAAIRQASRQVIIANAYFFPGHLLLREIRQAARRGVDVCLVMQAEPDLKIAKFAERLLYDYLLEGGIRLMEYRDGQYHGKLALIDDDWVTVGSSNLDPLSLWFNLEANVVVRDETFNRTVRGRVQRLVEESCREVRRDETPTRVFWRPVVGFLVFHFLRRFPRMAGLLPAHRPRLSTPRPSEADSVKHEAA